MIRIYSKYIYDQNTSRKYIAVTKQVTLDNKLLMTRKKDNIIPKHNRVSQMNKWIEPTNNDRISRTSK